MYMFTIVISNQLVDCRLMVEADTFKEAVRRAYLEFTATYDGDIEALECLDCMPISQSIN